MAGLFAYWWFKAISIAIGIVLMVISLFVRQL